MKSSERRVVPTRARFLCDRSPEASQLEDLSELLIYHLGSRRGEDDLGTHCNDGLSLLVDEQKSLKLDFDVVEVVPGCVS